MEAQAQPSGRGGIGRRNGLKANLSARRETGDVELLKFGETFEMAIPSQAQPQSWEGVETQRAAPTSQNTGHGEERVQTTNAFSRKNTRTRRRKP